MFTLYINGYFHNPVPTVEEARRSIGSTGATIYQLAPDLMTAYEVDGDGVIHTTEEQRRAVYKEYPYRSLLQWAPTTS